MYSFGWGSISTVEAVDAETCLPTDVGASPLKLPSAGVLRVLLCWLAVGEDGNESKYEEPTDLPISVERVQGEPITADSLLQAEADKK